MPRTVTRSLHIAIGFGYSSVDGDQWFDAFAAWQLRTEFYLHVVYDNIIRVPSLAMVLLTMTPSIVDALNLLDEPDNDGSQNQPETESSTEPAVGNPISHSEIISLYKKLGASQSSPPKYSLEQLLQGSRVYIPPPPPKPEPVSVPFLVR